MEPWGKTIHKEKGTRECHQKMGKEPRKNDF